MTPDEQKRVGQEIVGLIQKCILGKRWLRWPPGPMMGQVFDVELCTEDVRDCLTKFPTRPVPPAGAGASDAEPEK